MYKGSDRANVKLNKEKTNEISDYIDGRYFTQNEAHWNISALKMGGQGDISVTRLPYHLENHQPVRFTVNDNKLETTVMEMKFTEWFRINAHEKQLVEELRILQASDTATPADITAVETQLPKKRNPHDKYAFELLYQVIFFLYPLPDNIFFSILLLLYLIFLMSINVVVFFF